MKGSRHNPVGDMHLQKKPLVDDLLNKQGCYLNAQQ